MLLLLLSRSPAVAGDAGGAGTVLGATNDPVYIGSGLLGPQGTLPRLLELKRSPFCLPLPLFTLPLSPYCVLLSLFFSFLVYSPTPATTFSSPLDSKRRRRREINAVSSTIPELVPRGPLPEIVFLCWILNRKCLYIVGLERQPG